MLWKVIYFILVFVLGADYGRFYHWMKILAM